LKGDIEGQEVMTLKTQDIKGTCVDKMFTASDRHRKTVYINDVVKVLDGPLEVYLYSSPTSPPKEKKGKKQKKQTLPQTLFFSSF